MPAHSTKFSKEKISLVSSLQSFSKKKNNDFFTLHHQNLTLTQQL